MNKKFLFLIQLGTPKSPHPKDVSIYLKEFLMDQRVIDLPFLLRWVLVHLLIVPKRKYKSSKAYQMIWKKNGSPLYLNSHEFTQSVQEKLKEDHWEVKLAMRYGLPSIFEGLKYLKTKISTQKNKSFKEKKIKVYVQSLYPHYTLSAQETAHVEVLRQASKLNLNDIEFNFLPEFYDKNFFLQPMAKKIKKFLLEYKKNTKEEIEHLVFSYHGLPKRHIQKLDPRKHCCFKTACCSSFIHSRCYRAQCFKTTALLCQLLGWNLEKSSTCFQSRLLWNWIKPYTIDKINELKNKGIKKITVISPSFTADCLETLEEIDIQLKREFLFKGSLQFSFNSKKENFISKKENKKQGVFNPSDEKKSFYRIPCLNSDKEFVEKFASYIKEQSRSL